MANEITKLLDIDRKTIAARLAGPLAKLLSESGSPTTEDELKKVMLDPKTEISFPTIRLTRLADVVVTEVTVTETTTTSGAIWAIRRLNRGPKKG
jgi:hypothetical protein